MHLNSHLSPIFESALQNKRLSGPKTSIELIFDRDFFYFQGHFPKVSILPAAIAIELSLALVYSIEECDGLRLHKAKKCKFNSNIFADERIRVSALCEANTYKIDWRKLNEKSDVPAISLNLEFNGSAK